MEKYLTALLAECPTRDALAHLGLSTTSYSSLRQLCDTYGVEIPKRTNQHPATLPVAAPKTRKSEYRYTPAKSTNPTVELVVCLPDIHGHLVDKAAFSVALGFIADNPVDRVIVQGDGVDFASLAHFRRTLNDRSMLREEQRCGRAIRKAIEEAAPNAQLDWMEGNHERRLRDFLVDHADELSNLDGEDEDNPRPMLSVDSVLSLTKHGWNYIPTTSGKSTYVRVGNVCVGHFDNATKVPGSSAQRLMNDRNESLLQAHTHKVGGGLKRFPDGRTIMGYEIGCLCSLEPNYCTDPSWAHGFAILRRVRGSSRFDFHQVNIIGGEALIDGVRYTA